MSSVGSVTNWIAQLRTGDESSLDKLHKRYWPFLVGLAKKHLRGVAKCVEDEEDVAQKAFWGFYKGLKEGRLPRLVNRQDLLALLIIITSRKAVSQIEHQQRLKRGGSPAMEETGLNILACSSQTAQKLDDIVGPSLSAHEEAILKESYEQYVQGLPEKLRDFAKLYLAGCTYEEIAERLGSSERTVARKIPLIQQRWQQMAEEIVSR